MCKIFLWLIKVVKFFNFIITFATFKSYDINLFLLYVFLVWIMWLRVTLGPAWGSLLVLHHTPPALKGGREMHKIILKVLIVWASHPLYPKMLGKQGSEIQIMPSMLTFYRNFQTAISCLSFKTLYPFPNILANFRTKFSLLNQAGFDPNQGKENMILISSAGFSWVSNFKFPSVLCHKPWQPPTV